MANISYEVLRSADLSVDVIDVTSNLPYIDPKWIGVCENGHEVTTATVRWVVTDEWVDADGDDRTEGEYRCPFCDAVVEPQWTGPDMCRRFIPGMRHLSASFLREELDIDELNVGDTVTVQFVGQEIRAVVVSIADGVVSVAS